MFKAGIAWPVKHKKILNNFLTIMNAHLARIIKEQKKSDIHSKYTNFITPQSANCHFSCI